MNLNSKGRVDEMSSNSNRRKKNKTKKSPPPPRRPRNTNTFSQKNGYSATAAEYLRTVLAPCSGNARIPDYNCIPTSLVTVSQELILGVNAGGVGGVYVALDTYPQYYPELLATTTDAAITYASPTAFSTAISFSTYYSQARLVSACADVEFLGTTLSDSGLIVGCCMSAFNGTLETQPTNLAACLSTRVNESGRFSKGLSLQYRPNDAHSFAFRKAGLATDPFGSFLIHISGAATTSTYRIRFTYNYECIIQWDTINTAIPQGALQYSPVDPEGHAQAVNVMSRVKPVFTMERAQRMTDQLSSVAATGRTLWNAISGIVNGAKLGTKMLL